ncbi:chloride channel protein, partial [Erysipelatoclostridium ramosum]|nr:chloride channel protein [Thomasclavelia ramosa]
MAGLVGSLMNHSLLGFQTLYCKLPAWSRPMIAIAIALPVGIWLPDVLGGGSNRIDTAEHGRVGLGMLCLLFVAKMLFTSTSFGSGAPGGI